MVRLLRIAVAAFTSLVVLVVISDFYTRGSRWRSVPDDLLETIQTFHTYLPIPFLALCIVVVICWVIDRLKLRAFWVHMIIWAVPFGVLSKGEPSVIAACAFCGLIYWSLAGRFGGRPEMRLADHPRLRVFAFSMLTLATIYLVIGLYWWVGLGLKLAWVTAFDPLRERAREQPEYGMELDQHARAALWHFPDFQSCYGDVSSPPILSNIDWTSFNSHEEVEICLFHLFAAFPHISDAEEWAKQQDIYWHQTQREDEVIASYTLNDDQLRQTGFILYPDRLNRRLLGGNVMGFYGFWSSDGSSLKMFSYGFTKG